MKNHQILQGGYLTRSVFLRSDLISVGIVCICWLFRTTGYPVIIASQRITYRTIFESKYIAYAEIDGGITATD